MSSKTGKRDRKIFDAVKELDEEDAIALTHRNSSKRQRQASLAARSQQDIQQSLVQVRILLQRALQQQVSAKGTDDDEDDSNSDAVELCDQFLTHLLVARDSLMSNEPKSEESISQYSQMLKDDDEEALEGKLQSAFVECKDEWKSVFNQRHKDVRLHSGATSENKFRALDKSFWEQVEQTVSHEEFMRSRDGGDDDQGKKSTTSARAFDDSKVYQQILKDFLSASNKANKEDSGPSTSSSGRGLTVRTVNKVDRRASKGRKLRYSVISKLVNFTFPLSRPSSSEAGGSMMLEEDAWFKSLFGGAAASTVSK